MRDASSIDVRFALGGPLRAAGCDEAIHSLFERALAGHGVGAVEATT